MWGSVESPWSCYELIRPPSNRILFLRRRYIGNRRDYGTWMVFFVLIKSQCLVTTGSSLEICAIEKRLINKLYFGKYARVCVCVCIARSHNIIIKYILCDCIAAGRRWRSAEANLRPLANTKWIKTRTHLYLRMCS